MTGNYGKKCESCGCPVWDKLQQSQVGGAGGNDYFLNQILNELKEIRKKLSETIYTVNVLPGE